MAVNVTVPPFDVAPDTVVGGSPQSVFTFEFPFWDDADIIVKVDGVALAPSAYTVEGLFIQNGDPVTGGYGSGTVTLNDAVSDVTVTIDRFVVGARESVFSSGSPLPMTALNSDINKVTARQQDLVRRMNAISVGDLDQAAVNAAVNAAVGPAVSAAISSNPTITGAAQKSANLTDLLNSGSARTALGLGTAATRAAGVANGVATLGPDGLVVGSQLPPSGAYRGTWNATTNTPAIVSSVGTNGDFYSVAVAGTTTINGISSWDVGDTIRFGAGVWQKIPTNAAVASVNGATGAVALVANDVGAAAKTGSNLSTSDANALRSALRMVAAEAAKTSTVVGQFKFEKSPEEYRATGVSDAAAIQAAIDAMTALTGGGCVRGDGEYSIATTIVLKSNVCLRGMRFKAASGFTGAMVVIDPGSENTAIVGCYFDGDLMAITDPTYGASAIGFAPGATQAKAFTLTGCTFKMPFFPQLAPGADDPRFARIGGESDATYANRLNGPAGLYKAFHCATLNNILATITGNVCLQCGGDSFGLYSGLFTFTGNLVMFSGDGGLAVNITPAGVASGNHFFRCNLGVGIGSNVWVTNNGDNNPPSNPFSGLSIASNFFYGCGIGIEAGWFGVYLDPPTNSKPTEGPRYLSVIGNHFTRCKERAVGFFGREDTIDMNITVASNVVRECGANTYDGTTGVGDGIRIENCKGANVTSNHVVKGLGTAYKFLSTRQMVFGENHSDGNPVGVDFGSGGSFLLGRFYSRNDVIERAGLSTLFSGRVPVKGFIDGATGVTSLNHFTQFGIGGGTSRLIGVQVMILNNVSTWIPALNWEIDATNVIVRTTIGDPVTSGRKVVALLELGNYDT